MPRSIQLLKQIRNAVNTVNQAIEDPNQKMQLSIADMCLNEMMLQDDAGFYLDLLKQGGVLLSEGTKLAAANGKTVTPVKLRDDLDADTRIEAMNAEFDALCDALTTVVNSLIESRSAAEKDYLKRVTAWESSLYYRRREQVSATARATAKAITAESLQAYLQKQFPERKGLKVNKFLRLEGGISKMTMLFEMEDEQNGAQSLVLRADQPVNLLYFEGSDVRQEYYMIALMHKLGMPVAEPLLLEADEAQLGARFAITTKLPGKNIVGGLASLGIGARPPQEVIDSFFDVMVQMHGLKIDPNDPLVQKSHLNEWMPHKTIREAALYNATVFVPKLIRLSKIRVTPQLARAVRWLEQNVPDCDDPAVVVHVDYAFNNILFENNRISAVLDWETSRMGDPCDDILWSQQNLGVYSMPEFLEIYEKATSRHISQYRMAYAFAQKCVLNIIAGLTALEAVDSNDNSPLHMAVMGLKYMPLFGADIGELIEKAESLKGK